MNIKRALITAAVQLVAANTNLIARQDATTQFVNSLFGFESEEQRLVNEIDRVTTAAAESAKKIVLDHKFKKVTKNF